MHRLFIKASLLTGLILMLGVAGNAQGSQRYRAEIPFDFQIKNVPHKAGIYTIGPVTGNSSSGFLMIHDKKTGNEQMLGSVQLGGEGRSYTGKLVFLNTDGKYTLSEIITPTFGMKLKIKKVDELLVQNTAKKPALTIVSMQR